MILSAGGQDEHPCEVNNSTTARGSADAEVTNVTMAQALIAPDHRDMPLLAIIIAATLKTEHAVHRSR
jgi:hypothetical protein